MSVIKDGVIIIELFNLVSYCLQSTLSGFHILVKLAILGTNGFRWPVGAGPILDIMAREVQ